MALVLSLLVYRFGMNGYVRITSMGCSLADISTECMALAIQAIVYFTVYALALATSRRLP